MNTERVTRKLSAILSADVEGYSRLMGDDEVATVRTLEDYREVFADLIDHHRGRVVDSPGDNLLAEFGSVVDAVQCAVEVQQILKAKNAELPENRRMQFRIGVNLGDVIQEGDRIYGDGVNIAARIESLAEAGGICVSGSAYEQIENKLALGYEYFGEYTVKNIAKPIKVYKVPMEPRPAKKAKTKKWKKLALVAAGIVILGGGGLALWNFYFQPPPVEVVTEAEMVFPLPDKPSIAVLPFVNVSRDREQEYIADGITEQIITTLARNPHLFVIASNSTFTYKGKPVKVQQVSRELGVQYVVEGSVQKSGDKIRITAQLIDATKGEHMWAGNYDRNLKDIFALQDEIAIEILRATVGKLLGLGEQAREKGTTNVEAYLKVLKASTLIGTNESNNHLGMQMCKESIALDPEFAAAYSRLGMAHFIKVFNGWSKTPGKDMKRAFELAKKAIGLDQTLVHPHGTLGWIYLQQGKHEEAITEGEKAVALVPSSAFANATLGTFLAWADRPEEAILVLKNALRLNPLPTDWELCFLGNAYFIAGRYEEALAYYIKAQKRNPDNMWSYIFQASIYGHLGHEEEARATAREVLRINPKFSVEHWVKWPGCKNRDKWNLHINGLRKAGFPDKPPVAVEEKPSIAVLPFANISGDPKEDYLSDGITENIITALSKTPQMLVIARNSVFTYKGKPVMVQQVSEELGVRYVLEGSVQRSGDTLRVMAQLIDAKTGNHIWSESYDRELRDLFAVQDGITKNVITALQVNLTEGEAARLLGKDTKNLKAYLKLMKGRHHQHRWNENDNEIARRLLEEAIALDPNYASAYIHLAWTYYDEARRGWTKTPAESLEKAMEQAKKAITLDEQNASAYMVFANVYAKTGQIKKAIAMAKKGLSLDPSNSYVNAQYGMFLYHLAKFKEAILVFEKLIPREPKPPWWYWACLGYSYYRTGQNEEAISVFRKWVGHMPRNTLANASLGLAYVATGKFEEAIGTLEKALSLHPDRPGWYVGTLAVAHLGIGKQKEAITAMRDLVSRRPNSASFYCRFSMVLTSAGKYEEALSMAKKATSLEKINPIRVNPAYSYTTLGDSYCMMEQHEEAIAAFKKAVGLWPEYIYPHIGLTASHSLVGRTKEARAEAAEVLKINHKITLDDLAKNGFYNFQKADKERFINALRKAGLK